MVYDAPGRALREDRVRADPVPGPGELLVQVLACGVCRTDLHLVDGELPNAHPGVIPGHQIVGKIVATGPGEVPYQPGDRVGVPWLARTCGRCAFCTGGRENLCDEARSTGCELDGGYAELTVADGRFVFPLPSDWGDVEAAPLLCAGMIGFRALQLAGHAERIGLYGFGAAAHIGTQVARHRGQRVFAFTRPGDSEGQEFARNLGAEWAGGSDRTPPELLDAAVIFAAAGELVPTALASVAKGGTVVCAGIHMSDVPGFPYRILSGERVVRSVANMTHQDGEEFLAVARAARVRTTTRTMALERANDALALLRRGRIKGALVLVP